jgi:hypothetical protein
VLLFLVGRSFVRSACISVDVDGLTTALDEEVMTINETIVALPCKTDSVASKRAFSHSTTIVADAIPYMSW